MLDGRVLEASQVQYEPFGKPPLQREAAALHKAQVRQYAVHRLNAVRRAQDGHGQPVAPAAHHVHADIQRVLCARLRGLWAYSMTPGAMRLSKLVGCALSLSVFLLWQSPHSACRICTLPAAPRSQVPVSPQPHSAHLPSCAARVFCLSAAPGTSLPSSFKKISWTGRPHPAALGQDLTRGQHALQDSNGGAPAPAMRGLEA